MSRHVAVLVAAAALVVLVVVVCAGVGMAAGATTWDVYPGEDTPIQDAIDGAGPGDTIYVHAGTYVENVAVDKERLTLIGDGADVVTVRPAKRGHVFEVTGTWANISGFTVNGATRGAAWLYFRTDHCNISDNIASNNRYGICLLDSSSNTFVNNRMSENGHNFGIDGYSPTHYIQNIDTSNTVDGNPIYYWVDQKDRQIPSDAGFIGVVNGTNITVRDLTLTNNSHGVLFAYTENSRIENVTALNNGKGICLDSSSNNTLTGNDASSNSDNGICLRGSSNNTLTSNNASNNEYGIDINEYDIDIDSVHSSGNTLRKNAMSGNVYNFGVNVNGISIDTRLLEYIQNIDASNTVDGKPIYYWVGEQDKAIPPDAGFVGVVNCTNITVKDLRLTNNRHGVLFAYTENSRIENVTSSNNDEGICLDSSSNNVLTGNNASSNSGNGICIGSSSNNTLIENNASSNRCGIYLYCSRPSPSSNNTLASNTAPNNYYGIWLSSSSNNTLTGNTASNSYYGIHVSCSSNYNTLTDNTASNNDYGISLYESSDNVLTSNVLIGNEYNFGVAGYSPFGYTQNIDTSNTVDGKPIYYWVNQKDRQIPSDAGFVGVVNGTNITVTDMTLTNNGEGVLFAYTENSRIENVTASDNEIGIHLRSSSNNMLTDNLLTDNNDYSIYLEESSNNTLTDSEIGICLLSSSGNTIYHNNLISADHNAYDSDGTSQWDSGSEGNYYSDYTGTDNNTDGIGDTPYPIPGGGSTDRFPLMQPWAGDTPRKGDLNGDNQITLADAAIALVIAAGGSASCDPATFAAGDMSGDHRVTSLDALMILRLAAGAI